MSMDADEKFICDCQAEVCDYVRREAGRCAGDGGVAGAWALLNERIGEGYLSARMLREFARHDWAVDGVIILRTLYDATMQLLWLLADPDDRPNRAKMYHDFLEIETHRMFHRVVSSGTEMGAAIAKSPRLPAGEKQRQERLRTVGETYLSNKGRKLFNERGDSYLTEPTAEYRKHWYPFSNLAKLAAKLRYDSEYRLFQQDLSASVHASPWSLINGPTIKPEFVLTWALTLGLRAAGAVAETYSIPLNKDQAEMIDHAKRNMYDKPEPPSNEASGENEVTP